MDLSLQDQAQGLRAPPPSTRVDGTARTPRVIAVASGKGGVGKTSLVANLAIALQRAGERVLALDGDLGLANLDLTLGIESRKTLGDLLDGKATIDEVLTPGPEGISILPASMGRYDLANLGDAQRRGLFDRVDTLEERFDVLLIDTGAGIGGNSVAFAAAAQEVIIVANPEPTVLADAYACIKILTQRHGIKRVRLVANLVRSAAEGEETFRRLALLCERFLGVGVDYLGFVIRDPGMVRSLKSGTPALIGMPDSPAAQCIGRVARRLREVENTPTHGGISLFWKRLAAAGVGV